MEKKKVSFNIKEMLNRDQMKQVRGGSNNCGNDPLGIKCANGFRLYYNSCGVTLTQCQTDVQGYCGGNGSCQFSWPF